MGHLAQTMCCVDVPSNNGEPGLQGSQGLPRSRRDPAWTNGPPGTIER